MQVRKVIESDIENIVKFYMDCYTDNWTYESTHKRIMQVFTKMDAHCFIFEDNNQVFGFAMGYCEQFIETSFYFLTEIVIEPSIRGNGYGTMIMSEIESFLKGINVNKILLLSANDNMHKNFYDKLGFSVEKKIISMAKNI